MVSTIGGFTSIYVCVCVSAENNNNCLLYLAYFFIFFITFLVSYSIKEVLENISTDNMKYCYL